MIFVCLFAIFTYISSTSASDVLIHSYPFVVRLSGEGSCGGAIIGPSHVITARHCLKEVKGIKDLKVIAGAYDLSKPEKERRQERLIERYSEPKQKSNEGPLDVAIIKVDEPFKFNEYVQQAKLPKINFKPKTGTNCTTIGWGITNGTTMTRAQILQEVSIETCSDKMCSKTYGPKNYNSKNLCTCSKVGTKGPCNGDSGGPLLCPTSESSKDLYLTGVVSFGPETKKCGKNGIPSVFFNVGSGIKYIEESMKKM